MLKHNEPYGDDSRCSAEQSDPNTPRLLGLGNDVIREKVGDDEERADKQKLCEPTWRSNQIAELVRAEDETDGHRQREKAAHHEPRFLLRCATRE